MTYSVAPHSLSTDSADIVCDELGTPHARQWRGTCEQLGSDLPAIVHHHEQKRIKAVVAGSVVTLSGLDRVGLIVLPSGRRILLRTKISGVTLIDWLIYLGEFPDYQVWSAIGNVTPSDSWQKVLARLFLHELLRVTQFHLRKGYVAAQIESSTVKGRIRWTEAARKPWMLPRLRQTVRQRSFDMPANQMLAAALQRITLFQNELEPADLALFYRLRHEWSEIANPNVDRHQIIQTSLLAPPDGYRSALQLARLLLIGATIDSENGSGGQAFTLSLASIWENGLRRMCEDLSESTCWKVADASGHIRPWDDASGIDDPYRCMRADTLLINGENRWVLDAKYKRDFGDESRNDRFQMCAYAIGFRASLATLVYPFVGTQPSPNRLLLKDEIGSTPVRINSIALPMADGPRECSRILDAIMDTILTPAEST